MESMKKVRFLGLAQIYLILMDTFLKKGVYNWFEGLKGNKCSDKSHLLRCVLSSIICECCLQLAEI